MSNRKSNFSPGWHELVISHAEMKAFNGEEFERLQIVHSDPTGKCADVFRTFLPGSAELAAYMLEVLGREEAYPKAADLKSILGSTLDGKLKHGKPPFMNLTKVKLIGKPIFNLLNPVKEVKSASVYQQVSSSQTGGEGVRQAPFDKL